MRRLPAVLLAAAALLTGCGGGGGDGTEAATALGPSALYAGLCTPDEEKRFVRSYLDETYLWSDEIREVDPARYQSVPEYFRALLVTTPDANGLPRDRFSTVLPIPGAPANPPALAAALQAGPQAGLADPSGTVPVVQVVTSPGGRRSGYILFVDHAQDALIAAFRQLRDARVDDLVLDLRHNGGGFLYIALAAASMVTGAESEGRVFEQLRYNARRTAETAGSFLAFSSFVQFAEPQNPRGTPLPQLGLQRLYVLVSGETCSSSESIINGLRGIDVEVVLVGQTTCGKPFGFHRQDNCGWAFFPIEFQGFNAKGFGDYTAGFRPDCTVADNPAATPGSAGDPLLAAALVHMDTGACPAGSALSRAQQSAQPLVAPPVSRRPPWAGRLLATER